MVSRRRMHPVNNAAKQREQANRAGRGGRRSSWLSKETWEVGEDEAQCCVGFGPGLHSAIVGEKATFTIQTNDEEDKPLQYGGLEFKAFLEVSACVAASLAVPERLASLRAAAAQSDELLYQLKVTDNDDSTPNCLHAGTYSCSYQAR